MKIDMNILVLKSLTVGYANIVMNEISEENKSKDWYKFTCEIFKKLTKKKVPLTNNQIREYQRKFDMCTKLDSEYFADKQYSAFILMFNTLEYLLYELRDTEVRSKLMHLPYRQIRDELESMKEVNEIARYSDRFLTKLLDELGI